MKATETGLCRILKAFTYSRDGFVAAFRSEAALRQDVLFCLICGVILCLLPVSPLERAVMAFALIFILFAELVNTAVEAVVDRIGAEFHPLSKKAKDIGSVLVLIAFVNMFLMWGLILWDIWGT